MSDVRNSVPILICLLALIQHLCQDPVVRTWSAVAELENFAACSQWLAVLELHWIRSQLGLG